ncbi:Mut7-C RNAse domain-containing protein [Streptomyces albiaxialis]|uniref:Mut7-C RNAse domain-containing protein n=1 Tax=Streptomyces albiaxialis TaxID=329523 RepID=A0ABN2VTG3_9ACTN
MPRGERAGREEHGGGEPAPQGVLLRFAPPLRFFLAARHRLSGEVRAPCDGVSTLGHLVEAAGVPLTEVGALRTGGRADTHALSHTGTHAAARSVPARHRPEDGDTVDVTPVPRPQPLPQPLPGPEPAGPRFVLDVHLGALARRLRLVGVDAAYRNDAGDAELVEEANAARRVLLTRDRGLLRRRALWLGAYVRGQRPDGQLADVLDRFAVPLAPWTRCPACNGPLTAVPKREIADRLPPGTRRTYDDGFARCASCDRLYWPGAHHARLAELVERARRMSPQGVSDT